MSRKKSPPIGVDSIAPGKRRSRGTDYERVLKKRLLSPKDQIMPKENIKEKTKKNKDKGERTRKDKKNKQMDIEEGWDQYKTGNGWKSLPPRWADETDLDPEDLDARILRCERRIAQGIVPKAFELKLKRLLGMRDARQ